MTAPGNWYASTFCERIPSNFGGRTGMGGMARHRLRWFAGEQLPERVPANRTRAGLDRRPLGSTRRRKRERATHVARSCGVSAQRMVSSAGRISCPDRCLPDEAVIHRRDQHVSLGHGATPDPLVTSVLCRACLCLEDALFDRCVDGWRPTGLARADSAAGRIRVSQECAGDDGPTDREGSPGADRRWVGSPSQRPSTWSGRTSVSAWRPSPMIGGRPRELSLASPSSRRRITEEYRAPPEFDA